MDNIQAQQQSSSTELTWECLLQEYFFAHNLRPATEWSYKKVVRTFMAFYPENHFPGRLVERDILIWRRYLLHEKKLSPQTWNNKVTHLRALVNFAMEKGFVRMVKNPLNGCSIRKEKKRKKTLSKHQMVSIYLLMQQLEAQGEKARYVHGKISALYPAPYWLAVLDTLRFTGIRFNQLLHLKLSDVNVDMSYINLCLEGSKTHREWRVPLVGPLRARLRNLIRMAEDVGAEPNDFLFDVNRFIYHSRQSGKYAYSEKSAYQKIRSFFRRLSTIQGYHVTPHRFRHTLATELMKSPDRNLHMVKELLGHQNVATTMEYVEIELSIVAETLERELRLHTDLNEQEITGNVMNF